jgi:hypothetical protein
MAKIKVQFGQLTKPLEVLSIDEQTTLEQFCEDKGLVYDSSIRVNGQTAGKRTVLSAGDIITSIEDVDGGC